LEALFFMLTDTHPEAASLRRPGNADRTPAEVAR
jgi:hypothetical protein